MFNWLKRKSAAVPGPEVAGGGANAASAAPIPAPTTMAPVVHAASLRWDQTIAQVRAEYEALLAQATAGTVHLVEHLGGDLLSLSQPWGALEGQLHKHTERISDAWDSVGDELAEADDLSEAQLDAEARKRDYATGELEISYWKAYRTAMASGARKLHQEALAHDAAELSCSNCGAQMKKVRATALAMNVECAFCSAVNTLEPGSSLRMFAAIGAMWLAEEAALPHWETMTRAETEINQYRDTKDVPMSLLEQYNDAGTRYWQTRFETEAEFAPDLAPYVAGKVDSRLREVRKVLGRHWQWRERRE